MVLCNPMNLNYQYQHLCLKDGAPLVFREAADPSMIFFKGQYYLFPSMSLGFYVSDDMERWTYCRLPDELPLYDYAPDVRIMGDWMYFSASHKSGDCSFYRTKNPVIGPFEEFPAGFAFWDPNLFVDEDDRVYLYWGCSSVEPLYGVELDPTTMHPLDEPVPLLAAGDEVRGYERPGDDHVPPFTPEEIEQRYQGLLYFRKIDPSTLTAEDARRLKRSVGNSSFIEGPWLTKYNGRYYLQYAFAGTEYNIYGDGVYVSDSPLGPFTPAANNPYSYKPGGFINGAGHGSTMEDRHGNWWHTSSMRISTQYMFERRLGLWPAGFDRDGELFCNQRYGDWPLRVPDGRFDPWLEPEWMLLSYQKAVTASSSAAGHGPELAADENIQTWWRAEDATPDQTLTMDLGDVFTVHAVQVNFADDSVQAPVPAPDQLHGEATQRRYIPGVSQLVRWILEGSADGEHWCEIENHAGMGIDRPHPLVVREDGIPLRWLRLIILEMPYGQPAAVSGLRVFGKGRGPLPGKPTFTARRTSDLDMVVEMEAPGAVGCNILWGHAPDKLYHSCLTFYGKKAIGALVKNQNYFVRVDAFNEAGITHGTTTALTQNYKGDVFMRTILSLNDNWKFFKAADPANVKGESVTLPHTWNAVDGQDGGNDYHRGTCWYERRLSRPELDGGKRAWLEVKGAAMTCEVYLNGEKLARHEGGYSTFRVDLTDHLKDDNVLAILVDNSDNDTVYPQKADFTFYGGLYRDVNLIIVPATHFALGYCGTPGIKVTPIVDLENKTAQVAVETWQVGEGNVTVTVAGQIQTVTPTQGHAQAAFSIENVHLWDGVDDPYLYTATAALDSGDEVSARFGCRKFEIDPQKGFILNGRNYPLRGGSRHQDRWGVGNALTLEHHKEDMAIIRELGANTLRLAHYQHAQEFYDLCDENGIIVWAEIPYITMHMANGRANTLSQMEELVVQNYNHPCIAVWGLSNEITAASAVNEELLENHRALNDLCHKLDATRPTTMADVFMLEIESPILEIPDVNSYNLYFGWYLGDLEQNDEFFDEYHEKYPDRAIGFSEYGADANPQYQSVMPEKGDYTESYQCVYHEHMLAMIEARPWLWATHVWNLFDFGADGRNEGGKNGQNQKGLVTFDRKLKKDPFYLYKAAWNKTEPFVHLCGSRYVDRMEDVTEVKVYSNQSEVSLYVDGRLLDSQTGKTVFKFQVPITGEHSIEARSGSACAVMLVRKVDAPNPDYTMPGRAAVVNWFDQGDNDPTCFSINDKLGDLQAHPKAGPIINQMMAKGASSHAGDVADVVKDNPGLVRMMARMTLASLLKQSGADAESVQQLNRVLQGIKKSV